MVEPQIGLNNQIYNKHTGLLLGILGIISNVLTTIFHYCNLMVLQYISLGFVCYLLILGIYGSTKSCTRHPMIVNIVSLCLVLFNFIIIWVI